jgi:hypothetical protein
MGAVVTTATFQINRWMACGPGLAGDNDSIAYWRGEKDGTPCDRQAAPSLPPLLRRRVTSIGQLAFQAAQGLGASGLPRIIFCSRHGEFERTLSILDSLAQSEPVSPADFSMSVHNALAGLLSIATKNPAGHTAIAAGADSFGFGLIEAAACLLANPHEPILFVYYDEPLPGAYEELGDDDEIGLAVALLLGAAQGDHGDVSVTFAPASPDERPDAASRHALDFVRFLASHRRDGGATGERMVWRWSHVA